MVINPASSMAVQPELLSGESIFWADQPNPRVILHKEDMALIPFSLLWGAAFFSSNLESSTSNL